jgi:signal transduction histidine kinase/ActR/RegA family two-component response regulator
MHRCGGGSVVSRLRNLFTLSKGRADIQKPAWFFKRIRTKISDPISTRANSPEAIPDVEPVELTIAAQLTRDESSRRYKAGEVIIRENDVGETAYVIAQGQVEVSKGLDGQNVDLAYLGAGEIFGEMSMIDEKPRSATVTAITETLVSEIGRDDFFNSFQTDPKVALQLLQVLFERLRESDARILVGHLQRSLLTARVAAHAAEVEHEQRLLAEIKQRDAEQAKDKVTNILDELKRFNEELERRVAQRTEQLQQANAALVRDMEQRKKLENQLVQAQKMESVGTLAGGIAHDFNNLLNIIQGYAFILRGHCEQNEEMEQSLVAINDTVQRGSALVHQLLTLGRRSRGIGLKPVDINILVERLIVLIRQTFPKTIELDHILETDIPPIAGDKNQIEQALLNLCVNARDAMANRGTLMFKTHSVTGAMLQHLGEDLEGPYVCIEVTDTGVGMDEKVRSRIFEPFFTSKKKGQGTGLGLSVVYGIVKNHDGFIDVDSKPMAGTSFRLYFPAQAADAAVHEPITKVDAQPAVASNSSATVLIVEDEEMMLHALGKILGEQGYKVLKASDGEMALETYQRHKDTIDVVLLDLGLPKMSGRDVLLRMKNKNPDVKVVIASGHFEDELNSDIDQAGVKHLLRKPYMPDEVIKILQSLTKRN